MEISHFFVLAVLIGIAFARPRQRQSVEEALSTSRRSYAHSNAGRPNPWAWGQQSNVGLVEGLCKSVRADTSFLGTTTNTPVHFCQEASGICYYTSLRKCCNTLQSGGIEVPGGDNFKLGSTNIRVTFLHAGGFGSPPPDSADICFLVPDEAIQVCEAYRDCVDDTCAESEVCTKNAVNCALATGCECKKGYLPPTCCSCDEPDFIRSLEDDEKCDEICLESCSRRINNGGCSACLKGFVLTNRGCCNCRSDLEKKDNECVCQRPDQTLNENEECECSDGYIDIDGECKKICDNCAVFSEDTGCTSCKVGFQTSPLCCDCTGNRVKPDCTCPPGTIENQDNNECETCQGDLEPLNGVCACPSTSIQDGTTCINCPPPKVIINEACEIPPPECGKNQDIIIVQDNTQRLTISFFDKIMRALEFITSALKAQASNGISVSLVLYPVHRKGAEDIDARALFDLSADCSDAVGRLNQLAIDIYSKEYQSEETSSFEALEFIENSMIKSLPQQTTVLTITSGPSDATDAISRINKAINNIIKDRPNTRFYSAGLVTKYDDFDKELAALGENVPSHTTKTYEDVIAFSKSLVGLLVNASVLCSTQATRDILPLMTSDDSGKYANCVYESYNGIDSTKIGDCVNLDTMCPTSRAEAEESLENRMEARMEAMKQV